MKLLSKKVLFLFLVFFISFHVLLGENGFFAKQDQHIFPLGLYPSITHDSLSTRNPGIEDPSGFLVDLPGGYSFYLSPILVAIPLLSDNLINNFPLPLLIRVVNPSNTFLTQLEIQQYLFLGVSIVFSFLAGLLLLHYHISRRRKENQ